MSHLSISEDEKIRTRNDNGAENRNVQFCSAEDEGFRNEVAEGEEVCEQRQIVYALEGKKISLNMHVSMEWEPTYIFSFML